MSGRRIVARAPKFAFPQGLQKHWFAGSAFKTHWLNSYTLIIPEGEKYIHRSTKRFLDKADPALWEQMVGLLGQESSHSREHEKFFEHLIAQGYRIEGFLSFYRFSFYRVLERLTAFLLGPKALLSTASGLELINAVIAEMGLTNGFLDSADPAIRPLFEWHYAEEIEHKAVVFDVLQRVSPSYFLRAMGMIFATATFMSALVIGTMVLLAQDRMLFDPKCMKEAGRFFFSKDGLTIRLLVAIRDYLRPSFHPNHRDTYPLAVAAIARLEGQLGGRSR